MHLTHKPWTHYSYTVKPLYTGPPLHRTLYTQDPLYTGLSLHRTPLHRTFSTQDSHYTGLSLHRTLSKPDSLYTRIPYIPDSLYTELSLHRTLSKPDSLYTRIPYIPYIMSCNSKSTYSYVNNPINLPLKHTFCLVPMCSS